jgi:titin
MRSTFDFGLVTLDVNGLRSDDAGIYTCVAKNAYGEATTTCSVKVDQKHWLQSDSFRPDAIPKIHELEQPAAAPAAAPDAEYGPPVFITHLNNIEVDEGEPSLFHCQVEPWKDTKLEIGMRFIICRQLFPLGAKVLNAFIDWFQSGMRTTRSSSIQRAQSPSLSLGRLSLRSTRRSSVMRGCTS